MTNKVRYKVCHLLFEEFPSDPRIRRYVNALTENGIYSIIVCSKTKGDKFFDRYHGNLIYRIPISKHRQSFFLAFLEYIGFTFISAFILAYLGIKYRFKIIHSNTLPDFLIFAGIFNKIFGASLILDLHELFPEVFIARKPHLENSFYIKILKFQEKLSIKLANLVITIHEPAKQIFMRRNKNLDKKMHIIMNGVDRNDIENTKHMATNKFIIIYNGSIVKLCSLPLIIRSLNILKTVIPSADLDKFVFKIYGRGPDLNNIFNLADELNLKGKVSYEGVLSPDKMLIEVLKVGVYILPCIKNICTDLFYSIKFVEMIYLKIPVIATRLNTYKYYYSEDSLFYFDSGNDYNIQLDKITVFPWGIDLYQFKPGNKADCKKELGIPADKFVVVFNRYLEEVYGVNYMLDAFKEFAKDKDDIILLIVSDGSLRNNVIEYITKNKLESKIKLVGRVPNENIPAILNCSDVYISTSLSDGTSLSLLEALACGLGVIVTDVPSIKEWVSDENGIVVERKNVRQITEGLEKYYLNRDLIRKHGRKNMEIAKERADWDKNYLKLKEIYTKIAGR